MRDRAAQFEVFFDGAWFWLLMAYVLLVYCIVVPDWQVWRTGLSFGIAGLLLRQLTFRLRARYWKRRAERWEPMKKTREGPELR